MRDSKRIGYAVEELLSRMLNNANNDQDSEEFVRLACMCYALMWSLNCEHSENDAIINQVVQFDLDELADQGKSLSDEIDEVTEAAREIARKQVHEILKGRRGHGQYN